MGLLMKTSCERCAVPLHKDAYICVHECTFCEKCTDEMANICPNCSGELVRRPRTAGYCPISARNEKGGAVL